MGFVRDTSALIELERALDRGHTERLPWGDEIVLPHPSQIQPWAPVPSAGVGRPAG